VSAIRGEEEKEVLGRAKNMLVYGSLKMPMYP
jgi:hypothetical protein